jgi:hypothetical protein
MWRFIKRCCSKEGNAHEPASGRKCRRRVEEWEVSSAFFNCVMDEKEDSEWLCNGLSERHAASALRVNHNPQMPKIKTTRTKKPPEGYEEIESVRYNAFVLSIRIHVPFVQILDDYAKKMRDAENESHEGKRKAESLWPIMRISHTRSRYIYELYYKREAISKELYDWLLKEGYADAKCVISLFFWLQS